MDHEVERRKRMVAVAITNLRMLTEAWERRAGAHLASGKRSKLAGVTVAAGDVHLVLQEIERLNAEVVRLQAEVTRAAAASTEPRHSS